MDWKVCIIILSSLPPHPQGAYGMKMGSKCLLLPLCLITQTAAFIRLPTPPSPSRLLNNAATLQDIKTTLLKNLGDSGPDPVLACPVSLRPLVSCTRLAGPFAELRYKYDPDYGTKVCNDWEKEGGWSYAENIWIWEQSYIAGSSTFGMYAEQPFYTARPFLCESIFLSLIFQYPCNDIYADLVPRDDSSNRPFWELTAQELGTQELFRSPLTSFLYERGWRQNFQAAGFPGIDKEFDELMEFLGEGGAPTNYTIVDISCGSGLMTRRLVRMEA